MNNQPIIPFIEGDGTGPDIWRASVRVFDADTRLPSTPDELESLHERLGLPDAARAELEVALRIGRELFALALDELDERSG